MHTHGVRYFVGIEFGTLKVEYILKDPNSNSNWEPLYFPKSFDEGMDWLVAAYITGAIR
jgi:hypothetical protein